MTLRRYPNGEYKVGWICALPVELAAARAMLDEEHGAQLGPLARHDKNVYVLGSVAKHKVVMACLPMHEYGPVSAAMVAYDMLYSFPEVRFGLMVGIGAGIPNHEPGNVRDIRLGDVVVGIDDEYGGVVHYDFGRTFPDGSFEAWHALNPPPRALRQVLSKLAAHHIHYQNRISVWVNHILEKYPRLRETGWARPDSSTDRLFRSDYLHVSGRTCSKCDESQQIARDDSKRPNDMPVIHYGVVASGSAVIKHAPTRDEVKRKYKAICLEMEGAGIMNTNLPALMIRGISDYADSHKNDAWRNYAAATAAAFAKEVLGAVPVDHAVDKHSLRDIPLEEYHAHLQARVAGVSRTLTV